MNIKLRYDSRDKIFHQHFGQVFEFPDELNLDTSLFDDIQPIGDVRCTCFTTCDIAEDQTKTEFDISDLWARIKQSPNGADPRDVLSEAVRNGLLPLGKTERLKNWRSFWRGDIGSYDAFDNVRSALMLVNSPIGCGTFWYSEWVGDILPVGKNPRNGHMYSIEGWKQINGEPHLIIEAWIGRKMYMPRETFNAALKPLGMQTWVLSTAEIDLKREKSLIEIIKDLMFNLIILLRDLIKTHGVEPIAEVPPTPEPIKESEQPKYLWDTPVLARHSVRVICDEEKLTVGQKNTLCATVGAESGWNPKAIGKPNSNGTRDWGIVQVNDRIWIGAGKQFPTTAFVLANPEACVRWMCKQWKAGHQSYWAAYANGSFTKFL